MNMIRTGAMRRKAAGNDDATEFAGVMAALTARDAEIKAFAEKATTEIKANGSMAAETKSALEKLATDATGLQDRLTAIEQKMSRRSIGGGEVKSIGAQFAESDDFKVMSAKKSKVARMEIKAATITSATTDAAGSAGGNIVPDRQAGILQPAQRTFTIRQLLTPGRTTSNAIEYVKETGFSNGAAPVAEGSTKAQSDLQFDIVQTTVKTIAHWFLASKQVLDDVPMLQSYIDTRAIWGLKYAEENQLLAGDGTGQNLSGLLTEATAFSETTLSDQAHDTKIDTIRRAALQVRLAEYAATFVVLNPTDFADFELAKDDNGRYLWVTVPNGGVPQVWRLAVVETTAMTAGQFLVGASMGAQVFDREDAAVEVSAEDSDNFRKNLITIRAEERLALAITRPESFVYGQFELGTGGDVATGSINA